MAIRSTRLGARVVTVANSWQLLGTVPAGETWIIKSIVVQNVTVSVAVAQVRLNDAVLGVPVRFVQQTIGADGTFLWSDWVVAPSGVLVEAFADQQPMRYWVSGTALQG